MFEFMHDQNMSESVELARNIQKNLCISSGRQNKGVKQDVFLVLRETSMPACLIELGFITTPDEERMLNDERHIEQMAKELVPVSILNYSPQFSYRPIVPVAAAAEEPAGKEETKRSKFAYDQARKESSSNPPLDF